MEIKAKTAQFHTDAGTEPERSPGFLLGSVESGSSLRLRHRRPTEYVVMSHAGLDVPRRSTTFQDVPEHANMKIKATKSKDEG
jgi:hypothetical protein